jgi:hypothetical protein
MIIYNYFNNSRPGELVSKLKKKYENLNELSIPNKNFITSNYTIPKSEITKDIKDEKDEKDEKTKSNVKKLKDFYEALNRVVKNH